MNTLDCTAILNPLCRNHRPLLCLCLLSSIASGCVGPTMPTPASFAPGPVLLSPPDGGVLDNGCVTRTDGITWEFDWSDVQHATRYHLLVQRLGASIPVIDVFTADSAYRYVAPGAYIIERNRFEWQWKVEAEVHSVFGGYSPARTFSVEPLSADCQ